MKWFLRVAVAMCGAITVADGVIAQSFRPAPSVRPTPRPSVTPTRPVVTPTHPVVTPHRPRPPAHPGQTPGQLDDPGTTEFLALAASSIGILGSPQGDAPLLAATTYWAVSHDVAERHVPPTPVVAEQPPVQHRPSNNLSLMPFGCGAFAILIVGIFIAVARASAASARRGVPAGIATIPPGKQLSGHAAQRIRINALPPGEAPEHVRAAWIGLELPLVRSQADTKPSYGVFSNRVIQNHAGYAVDGATAVALLGAEAPEAAAWWRQHAPHILVRGSELVFPAEVCERVGL